MACMRAMMAARRSHAVSELAEDGAASGGAGRLQARSTSPLPMVRDRTTFMTARYSSWRPTAVDRYYVRLKSDSVKHFGFSRIDLDRQHPGTVVVSTSDRYGTDDIYLSHDSGATWTSVDAASRHHTEAWPWLVAYTGTAERGTTARQNMGHWMDGVKINPFDGNELIYGTGYGVWMTHDLGAIDSGGKVDFDFADANLEETVILGLESPSAGPHVRAAVGDVAGGAWDDVTKGPSRLFTPEYETNQSVAYAALRPDIMARTADQAATSGYLSKDGGKELDADADDTAHYQGCNRTNSMDQE